MLAGTVASSSQITTIEGLAGPQGLTRSRMHSTGPVRSNALRSVGNDAQRACPVESGQEPVRRGHPEPGQQLCRCTGHTQIFEAVKLAASMERGEAPDYVPGASDGFNVLGGCHRKADGHRKATGAAIYTDDVVLSMLHGKILRVPTLTPSFATSIPAPPRPSRA